MDIEMKDIKNFEGLYAITSDGMVWSYRSHRFLTSRKRKDGYWQINFSVDGTITTHLIHRLVAETWIPNYDNKPTVDHIDKNKNNNHISNLRWATYSEQVFNEDTTIVHSKKNMKKMREKAASANYKPIEKRDMKDHSVLYATYSSAEEAAIVEFNDASKKRQLQKCARGVNNSAYGYWWCYKNK